MGIICKNHISIKKRKNVNNSINLRKSICSLYLLKEIFSFLDETKKLNIIIYNQKLQKVFGVDKEYYKKISGKYRSIDKSGYGYEYELHTKKLIFQGKYLNGKKNGYGKELYSNGNLKFDGEYLNGKRLQGKGYNSEGKFYLEMYQNGITKEFYSWGLLKFYGQYLNDRRWNGNLYNFGDQIKYVFKYGRAKVKEYNFEGDLEFEGEYINGKRSGKCKEYNKEGNIIFEGEYFNGKRWNGKGKEYKKQNLLFVFEYTNGKIKIINYINHFYLYKTNIIN